MIGILVCPENRPLTLRFMETKKKILIVEDQKSLADMYKTRFEF